MDFTNLKNMSQAELLNIARTQGLKVHHKNKPETIIKAIMDSLQPQAPQVAPQASQRPVAPVITNTADTVEAALAAIKAKQPKLESSYDGDVWTFSYRNANGRVTMEESGNLNIPLRTIVGIATRISRGPVALIGLNEHFDRMPSAEGKNAYTNTVLR